MSDAAPSPNALCFGPDLPAAGVACHLELRPDGLCVTMPGSRSERVPFTALSLAAGGFDKDHLVLSWSSEGRERRLYVKDAAVIVAFRRFSPPHLTDAVEQTAAVVRQQRLSRRALLVVGLVGVLAAVLAIWLGSDAIVATVVERIPIEWEQALGEAARREFLEGQTIIETGPSVEVVNEITRRLTQPLTSTLSRFQITIVRNDLINAFALPGGSVIVFTGLIQSSTGPEEVAGVLSHEFSHVLLRHALKRVVKNVGLMAVVTIMAGDQQGMMNLVQRLILELATLRFSREQEIEADLAGLRLLQAAHISPAGLIAFFERLATRDPREGDLLSTHPMSQTRAERLKREAAAVGADSIVPFSLDWDAVQQSLS